jgi:hypothetical protein
MAASDGGAVAASGADTSPPLGDAEHRSRQAVFHRHPSWSRRTALQSRPAKRPLLPDGSGEPSYGTIFLARGITRLCAFLLLLFVAAGCSAGQSVPAQQPATAPPWFREVTDEVGLHFTHDAGPTGSYFMPQIVGSGAALLDFDNDGRLDIYLLQNGGPDSPARNHLFHQEADGRFTDVSAGSGLDIAGFNMGVAIGDVNNDGFPDVLVTQYGGIKLFLNNGNGTFTDATAASGLEDLSWGTSAAFVDYDRDGWLDLVVVHYVIYDSSQACSDPVGRRDYCHPSAFPPAVTRLYHNLGSRPGAATTVARVAFEDVTEKAGLGQHPGPGLGVLCADFDGDGWPDLFVANDGRPNHLWINRHDGTFREEGVTRGVAYPAAGQAQANMGIACGDVDGDGLFDLVVTHLTEETNTLWVQGPRGMFRDRTVSAGIAPPQARGTGFGTVLADFDNNGSLDLAVVNGRVHRAPAGEATILGPFWGHYGERNRLLANDGSGRFRDISDANPALCATPGVYRALACGDVDGDGALDLLVTAVAGPARLYRNVTPARGHWLLVRAVDPRLKRDAYGAEITIEAGRRRWVGWINPGQSYLCSGDPRAHFGLGEADRVERIRVRWPDGVEELFPPAAADKVLLLVKGQGAGG